MKKWILTISIASFLLYVNWRPGEKTEQELGRMLFFDPILSRNNAISCASCHRPAFAFADTLATSLGVDGRNGTRNTPSAMNVRLQRTFFWDGRAGSLEEQALKPIENPAEMDLPIAEAVKRLQKTDKYVSYFQSVYNSAPTSEKLAKAITAFERTLETSDSPFDHWKFSGKEESVSEEVKRGFQVFNTKGKCSTCHFGADFTSNDFRNIGLFNGKDLNDSGRILISKNPGDLGKFKIGSLRNVAITAPYMHNGMFRTLEEVIEFYDDPSKVVPDAINTDSLLIKPLGLTKLEKSDLKAFLMSLTDKRFGN